MPRKKLDIVEIDIPVDMSKEPDRNVSISKSAKTKLDELVNEQKVIANAIINKKKKQKEDSEAIKRVFKILKDAFELGQQANSQPEPISGSKLIALYGEDIVLNSLTAKIRKYLRSNYDGNLALVRKTKNKRAAYILVRYGS